MLHFSKITALIFAVCLPFLHAAEPTANRSWKSSTGTSIEAKATAIVEGVVTLETPTGRILKVELSKLSNDDRTFLETHFGAPETDSTPSGEPVALPHPQGKLTAPIEAEGSHYHLYIPNSLKAGKKAPLLFFTHSGGGSTDRLSSFVEGAEICGWIIAISVEATNGLERDVYYTHTGRCLDHIAETLPVDPQRIYFSGESGGSRVAFGNSVKFDGAGVLAVIAGGKPEELNRKRHYFFVNGATDYNRYNSAISYEVVKANSAFRFHTGTHERGPDWLMTEGMVWLDWKWHEKAKTTQSLENEKQTLSWIEKMKTSEPHRAAWWANYVQTIGLSPQSKIRAQTIIEEQATKPDTTNYANAIAEIEKFASTVIAKGPQYSPECFNHTSPEIQKKVDKMIEMFGDTPWIREVLKALKEKTGQA